MQAVRVGDVLVILVAFAAPRSSGQVIKYVDVDHPLANDSLFGTSSVPWQSLTVAMTKIQAGEILYVRSGNYDGDASTNGVAESFPIEVPRNIQIIGVNDSDDVPSSAERPRIGDGAAGFATHLFEITADTSDDELISISRLHFVGENEPGLDSPVALWIRADDDLGLNLDFTDNVCDRPYMNASGASGLATIHVETERGNVSGGIRDNQIQASNRGGIEVLSLQPPLLPGQEDGVFGMLASIERNHITNPGGLFSQFGVKWWAPDLGGSYNFAQVPSVNENVILSRGENLQVGIEYHADENTAGRTGIMVPENRIDGCGASGIVIRADGADPLVAQPELQMTFERNVIVNNAECGIRFVWDERNHSTDDGAGYILVELSGNNIADNGEYGYAAHNVSDSSVGGVTGLQNTIVNNGLGAIAFIDPGGDPAVSWVASFSNKNSIVYANNSSGNGDQIVGTPGVVLDALIPLVQGLVTYSDWEGIPLCPSPPCPSGNIDVSPLLSSSITGVYHLQGASLCIDAGLSPVGKLTYDIDMEIREQDGKCDGFVIVDMGADEYPDRDCPAPE